MEKAETYKEKDNIKINDKIWVDESTTYKERNCGSGLTFSGRYKNKK